MSVFANYQKFTQKIDTLCNKILSLYSEQITCSKSCSNCCISELTVLPIEADYVKEKTKHKKIKPNKTKGSCIMLEGECCQIYEYRPLVCRTQGFTLLYGDELSFCDMNFKNMTGGFCFSSGTLIDMDKVNLVLVALNMEYLKQTGDLDKLKDKRYKISELIK